VMGMEYFILEELGRRGLPISLYAYEWAISLDIA
jgi:hypothetical protein